MAEVYDSFQTVVVAAAAAAIATAVVADDAMMDPTVADDHDLLVCSEY